MKKKKILICLICLISIIAMIILLVFLLKTKQTSNNTTSELSLPYEVDYDVDEDVDGDGLTNPEEKKYGTDPLNSDTDLDGLLDREEISVYKTDPLNRDTDGDGLTDFNEIELGFDTLNPDTDGDGKKDIEEHTTYSFEQVNMIINVSGKGNIADTYAYIDFDTDWSTQEGAINREYSFSSKGDIDELKVSFIYTEEELKDFYIDLAHVKKYIAENPNMTEFLGNTDPFTYLTGIGVCKVNKQNSSKCEYIAGTVDTEKQTITVTLDDYQNYVYIIGDIKELSDIEMSKSSKLDKSNNDLILVADSGFDVKKDGFSFENYVTNFAEYGHCYGMALFSDLYYTKSLPLTSEARKYRAMLFGLKIPFSFHNSYAYDLTETHFSNYLNLYDYKLEINLSDEIIDEEKMQTNKNYNKTDVQLLNAIYQLYTMQGALGHYSSGGLLTSDWLSNYTDALNSYGANLNSCNWDGTVIIDFIAKRLRNKEVPLLVYNTGEGRHAVNIIRLYRYNNQNKYKMCIYNNNYPGEEKWLDIEMGKKTCTVENLGNFFVLKSLEDVFSLYKYNINLQ